MTKAQTQNEITDKSLAGLHANGGANGRTHGRKAPPDGETAHDRFLRLGQPRVRNALYAIRLIGNLSQDAYQWEDSDVELIEDTLRQAMDLMVSRFKKAKPPRLENSFQFTGVGAT